MNYPLIEWEANGYHDSDFYLIYWDAEAGEVKQMQIGSTAFAGGCWPEDCPRQGPPAEELERARVALEAHILAAITEAEQREVFTPQNATMGTELLLLADSPARSKTPYKAGEWGDVFWVGAFGRFYRNGYNKPNRENRRVGLRLADGRRVFAPLSACRLKRDPLGAEELARRARELSHHYQFGGMFGRFTWASRVYFTAPKIENQTEATA